MPFEFNTSYTDEKITLLWKYDELDIVDDLWRNNIHTLSIIGKDQNGRYVNSGKWCIHMIEYNEVLLTNHRNNIRNLPVIDLDIIKLFPNLRCLSLTHLNINKLVLPKALHGWVSTDTQIKEFNMPTHLYWLTFIYCYGCWSNCNILPNTLCSLSIYGDYCNIFNIPYNLDILNIISCKFNRLQNVFNLYNISTFNIRASSPYNKIITTIQNTKKNIHNDIQSIVYKNNHMDAEKTTEILVLLRNSSFIPVVENDTDNLVKKDSENVIRNAMVLGSNYPRRSMEFLINL
jgi:hypothetical protein